MAKLDQKLDKELATNLKRLADENRLVDFLTNLLISADQPEIKVGNATIMFQIANPTPNDKSCYKKCLKDDIKNPGSYAACIKKCRPATKLILEFTA